MMVAMAEESSPTASVQGRVLLRPGTLLEGLREDTQGSRLWASYTKPPLSPGQTPWSVYLGHVLTRSLEKGNLSLSSRQLAHV